MRSVLCLLALGACSDPKPPEAPPPAPHRAPPDAAVLRTPKLVWDTKYGAKLTFEDPELANLECSFVLGNDHATKAAVFKPSCRDTKSSSAKRPELQMPGFERKGHELMPAFHGNIVPLIANVPIASLKDQNNAKWAVDAKVSVDVAGYGVFEVTPPLWWVDASIFHDWLGVTFGTEPPDDGKLTALAVHEGYSGHTLFGDTTGTLHDLDWIVIQRDHTDGKKLACSHNTTYLLESTITIYDRRTRAVIDERRLEGKSRCPQISTYYTAGSRLVAQTAIAIGPKELKTYVEERLKATR